MITLTTPTAYDDLPQVKQYQPMNTNPPPNPEIGFLQNKIGALENNVAEYQKAKATVSPYNEAITTPESPTLPTQSSLGQVPSLFQMAIPASEIVKQVQTHGAQSVSSRAYQLDPGYRGFVDHYKNGAMAQLPDSVKNNFDDFALNTYYRGSIAPDRTSDLQALNMRSEVSGRPFASDKEKEALSNIPKWVAQGAANDALSPFTIYGAGMVGAGMDTARDVTRNAGNAASDLSGNGGMNDPLGSLLMGHPINSMIGFGKAIGDLFGGSGGAPERSVEYAKTAAAAVEPLTGTNFDQQVQTAGNELSLASMLFPGTAAFSPLISGALAAPSSLARQHEAGQDPNLITTLLDSATSAGLAALAPFAPRGYLGNLPGTNFAERMVNAGLRGAEVGTPLAGLSNASQVVRGNQTPGEALYNTAAAIPSSFITGAEMQGGKEAVGAVQSGIHKVTSYLTRDAALSYKEAVAMGGASAEKAMRMGAHSSDIVQINKSTPEELKAMSEVDDIAVKRKMDRTTPETVFHPVGKFETDKLEGVVTSRGLSEKTMEDVRARMSSKNVIQVEEYSRPYEEWLNSKGMFYNADGTVDTTKQQFGTARGDAQIAVAAADLIPNEATTNPKAVDAAAQKIGKMIGDLPQDSTVLKKGLGILYWSMKSSVVPTLSPEDQAVFQPAQTYWRESGEALDAWGRLLRTKDETRPLTRNETEEFIQNGSRDERAGAIARRLTQTNASVYLPAFEHVDTLLDLNPYKEQVSVPEGSAQKLAIWAGTMEDALKVAPRESLKGQTDARTPAPGGGFAAKATSWIPIVGPMVKSISNAFGDNAWNSFKVTDEYLKGRIANPSIIPVDPQAIETNAQQYKAKVQQDSETLAHTQQMLRNAGEAENRLTGLKGGQQGVAGMDFPAEPPKGEPAVSGQAVLSKQNMIDRGADGYLNSATEKMIPVEKIVGREPTPSMEGGYKKGTPITQPIEVTYDPQEDTYTLFSGNHRVTQAEINGQTSIPAFVETPSKSYTVSGQATSARFPESTGKPLSEIPSGQAILGKGESFEVPIEKVLPPKGIDKTFAQHAPHSPPPVVDNIPLDVVQEGDNYRITDGVHRLAAALRRGDKTIRVNIP